MGSMPGMSGGMGGGYGGMAGGMMGGASQKRREDAPVPIDRVNIVAQQLATSLRIPLNRPVLVGGMTFPGVEGASASDEQLYLVLEVTAQEEPSPSGAQPRGGAKKARPAAEK